MQPPTDLKGMDGPDASPTRGLLALAHPVAIAALVVLVVNDHLLKQTFGSGLTGKLSDIAGAVLVPLLVAAAIERFTSRAIEFGMASTALVLTAINLFSAADRMYEAALSLVLPSSNTMDPTDLVAVPCVLIAGRVWRSTVDEARPLRRAWGMAVFFVGVSATLATSNDVPSTQAFSGTVFLTAEEPSVEIPVEFTLNGEDASVANHVEVGITSTVFGDTGGLDPQALVTIEKAGEGDGTVTLSLERLEAAPIEVEWSMIGYGIEAEVCVPFCLGGGEEEGTPKLTVEAPPDSFGPNAFEIISVETGGLGPPSLHRGTVTFAPGTADLVVGWESPETAGVAVIEAGGTEYPLRSDSSTSIPRPDGCEQGCELPLEVSTIHTNPRPGGRSNHIEFFIGEGQSSATAEFRAIEPETQTVELTMSLPPVTDEYQSGSLPLAVKWPDPIRFGDAFEVVSPGRFERYYSIGSAVERARVSEELYSYAGDGCVLPLVTFGVDPASDEFPIPNVSDAPITVTYYSFPGADSSPQSELRAAIGDAAEGLC